MVLYIFSFDEFRNRHGEHSLYAVSLIRCLVGKPRITVS